MLILGLRTKIILWFIILITLVGLIIVVFVRDKVATALQEQYQSKGISIAANLSIRSSHFILTQDYIALQNLMDNLKRSEKDVRYVFIVDKRNQLLSHTFAGGFPEELLKINKSSIGQPHTIQLINTEDGLIRDIAVPILDGKIGIAHIGVSEKGIQQTITDVVMIIISIVVIVLAVGSAIGWGVGTIITKPVRQLTKAVQEISRGDFNQQIAVNSQDEVGQLTESFNKMARDLSEQREKLLVLGNEQRHLQVQLHQQEKMSVIGQLAASVAHELNTPLNTILLQSQLLEEDLVKQDIEAESKLSALRTLETEAQRCKQIVRNLLDFSRQTGGEKTITDIHKLLDKTVHLMSNDFKLRKVIFSITGGTNLPEIRVDENQIQQVFFNLINNALDAMPEGGAITVSAEILPTDNFMAVSISDTGCGISKDALTRIFDPFYTTKPPGKGTGLGLPICKRIIRDHNGTIEVQSDTGKGTIFIIKLPVSVIK